MVFVVTRAHNDHAPHSLAKVTKGTAVKIVDKIAAVIVTLLLYFVIAMLQMPKAARAAEGFDLPGSPALANGAEHLATCAKQSATIVSLHAHRTRHHAEAASHRNSVGT